MCSHFRYKIVQFTPKTAEQLKIVHDFSIGEGVCFILDK